MRLVNDILSNPIIHSAVADSNGNRPYPNTRKEHTYVLGYVDTTPIGVGTMHPTISRKWQCHFSVLPEYRLKYARKFAVLALQWVWDNTEADSLYIYLPEYLHTLYNFAKKFGFVDVEFLPKSFIENGQELGTYVLKLTRRV